LIYKAAAGRCVPSTIVATDRSDSECLDLFLKRGHQLFDEPVVASGGLNVGLRISGEIGEPLSLSLQQPDERLLRSFLMTFRQFVLNNEDVYLPKIHNILWRRIESDEIREHLAAARQRWNGSRKVGSVGFEADAVRFAPADMLDLWLNGHYFHSDSRKEAELERLDPIKAIFTRHLMLDLVVETTRYIRDLANVIVVARREGLLD
jgi:hypothetical protein